MQIKLSFNYGVKQKPGSGPRFQGPPLGAVQRSVKR